MHDWWVASVAVRFGLIVSVGRATVSAHPKGRRREGAFRGPWGDVHAPRCLPGDGETV